jgi:hypothetical protein
MSTIATPARPAKIIRRYFSQSALVERERVDGEFARNSASAPLSAMISRAADNAEPEQDALPQDLAERLAVREPYIVSFRALQEWEGYVIAINGDTFTARLVDITAGDQAEGEDVSLPLADLTPEEQASVVVGSVLRWVIGYQITQSGQRKRASQIIFRQLPRWTRQELDNAAAEGRKRAARIRWE